MLSRADAGSGSSPRLERIRMIKRTPFGTAPDGQPVTVYELAAGSVRVRIMDFGATIVGIDTPDASGNVKDIVLGFGSLEGYFDNPAGYGATIGPSANRTDKGEVPIAGTVYQLAKNDGPTKENNLHTDLAHGLHKRVWKANADEGANQVTFTYQLEDGELGLPGNRTFTASYRLTDAAEAAAADAENAPVLTLSYCCDTDVETFVNMTNHVYFNLAGHDSGTVRDQLACVHAEHFLPLREDSVSTGEVRTVAGTPFDFRAAKTIGAQIDEDDEQLKRARGYDHCFCVDGYESDASPRPALTATDPASGRTLSIDITAPGAHLYTGNWLGDENAKDGASYTPNDGFAFEPEFWPDNVHHEDWEHPVCTPEHPWTSTIVYRFSAATAKN